MPRFTDSKKTVATLTFIFCSCFSIADDIQVTEEEISSAKKLGNRFDQIADPENALDRRIKDMISVVQNRTALLPYEPNYILLTGFANNDYDVYDEIGQYIADTTEDSDDIQIQQVELKFQFSVMFPIRFEAFGEGSSLMAAYTQQSWWQAFNFEASSPFRETNYEPRVFASFVRDYDWKSWTLRYIEVGFAHQSNGREEIISRSWNRLYTDFTFAHKNLMSRLSTWYRIPDEKDDDDNPDLHDYMGYFELMSAVEFDKKVLSMMNRFNPSTGYGAIELGFSRRISDQMRWYVQAFQGYGESLIEYDHEQTRIGVGVMLQDFL